MLSIPQLKQIEIRDPYAYEVFKRIVAAINSLGQRVGIDPIPSVQAVTGKHLPPPGVPAALSVTAARGVFSVSLTAPAGSTTPIFYFLEAASDTAFANTTVYPLGSSLGANISLGNVTRYWRARAKYIESDYGPYTYFGTPANPTAVVGGLAGSGDIQANAPFNYTNNATVDSIDAGTSATVRIYGPGGVGMSWTRFAGNANTTYPAGTITGLSYSTAYYVTYNGTSYSASTATTAAMPDNLVWSGKVTTAAAGGGGGTSGGGGSGGGGGGRILL
jgi:hypothetical protein